MKFRKFRDLKIRREDNIAILLDKIYNFLKNEVSGNFKDLANGLSKLSFRDNFESFEVDVTIPANSELKIPNQLGVIPTGKIILRAKTNDIVDGDSAWTDEFVYLKNNSATQQTAKVVFLK